MSDDDTIDVSISMSTHVGDDATETDDLSLTEYGAHARLRRALWRRGGVLDGEMSRLRRLVGAETDADLAALESVVARIWLRNNDGTIVHEPTLAQIDRARAKKASYIARGKEGGRGHKKADGKLGESSALAEGKAGGKTPPPPPPPDPSPTPEDPEVCAEPAEDGPASAPPEPPLVVFPCAGPLKTWALTEPIRAELAEAFPAVDVLGVARKALEWCKANPRKIKTARRMRGWLGSVWMGPAQDRPSEPGRQQGTFGGNRFPSNPIPSGPTWTKAKAPKIAPVTSASARGWPSKEEEVAELSAGLVASLAAKVTPS